MLLAHSIAVAEACSYIAALDDNAATTLGSIAYDRTLIYLDTAHGDHVPALTAVPVDDPVVLYRLAKQAVEALGTYGLDPLHVELALAYLSDAWALDNGPDVPGERVLPSWIDPGEPT
jgi:hypothetical protein